METSENIDPTTEGQQVISTVTYTRTEGYEKLYANSVSFESNVWDIRAIFGQLLTNEHNEVVIEQHTSVAMPWTQAKIACFHMAINIIGWEQQYGPIRLPPQALPSAMGLTEMARNDPRVLAVLTALMGLGNPEIFKHEPQPSEDQATGQ